MTKSSSCLGEGDGESLCFPLLDGKGDLKDEGGWMNGFGEEREAEDWLLLLLLFDGNHEFRFRPLDFDSLNPEVEVEPWTEPDECVACILSDSGESSREDED